MKSERGRKEARRNEREEEGRELRKREEEIDN